MNLKEIRAQVQDATTHREGESLQDFADRSWTDLPRVPYDQLPASLKKAVRERISPESLREWLEEFQAWLATDRAAGYEWLRDRLDEELQVQADNESDRELLAQKKLDRLLLRVRNTATYTIDAPATTYEVIDGGNGIAMVDREPELVPNLYADHAQNALEALLREDSGQPVQSAIPAPRATTGGSRQRIISDKVYSNAFKLQPAKGKPYLAKMTPNFFEQIESGAILPAAEPGTQFFTTNYEDAEELDVPLLQQIFSAISKSGVSADGYVMTIDFQKFMREMGKDTSGNGNQNAAEVLKKIHTFEQFIGYLPTTGKFSRLLVFMEMEDNLESGTIQLASPYMFALARTVDAKRLKSGTRKDGETWSYHAPAYNDLCHSSIAKERNKAAVLLVYEITNRLLQRGGKPDAKTRRKKDMAEGMDPSIVSINPTCRELVNAIPLLRGRVQRTKDPNTALKRAFKKAYELLDAKTDAHLYFRDLQISPVYPTMRTLDMELLITHKGRNPNYTRVS